MKDRHLQIHSGANQTAVNKKRDKYFTRQWNTRLRSAGIFYNGCVKYFVYSRVSRLIFWGESASTFFWLRTSANDLAFLRHPVENAANYYTHLMASLTWQPGQVSNRKAEPFWVIMKQEMTGWQWHQLDHMQIIHTSLQTDNSTPSLIFVTGRMFFPLPNQQYQSTEGSWQLEITTEILYVATKKIWRRTGSEVVDSEEDER